MEHPNKTLHIQITTKMAETLPHNLVVTTSICKNHKAVQQNETAQPNPCTNGWCMIVCLLRPLGPIRGQHVKRQTWIALIDLMYTPLHIYNIWGT